MPASLCGLSDSQFKHKFKAQMGTSPRDFINLQKIEYAKALLLENKKALIDIIESCVIKGSLPSRQLKLVLAWGVIHQDELMQNWELAKDGKPLNRINPLV